MTDTEAKARAVIQSIRSTMLSSNLGDNLARAAADELERAIEAQEATESHHAAEMRELKERFSEVAYRAKDIIDTYYRNGAGEFLTPFIIAKPDPLVEYLVEVEGYFPRVAKEFAERLRAATRGGKIVWESGE